MNKFLTQLYPPKPKFTDEDVPSQKGKVFIVTGGNNGVGFELVKLLYTKGAKIYVAGRSQSKCEAAIKSIQSNPTSTPGELKHLHLDLEDLSSVKKAAQYFLAAEDRLDILWNNAGVTATPEGGKYSYEYIMRINCVGPFLFTKLLLPLVQQTAKYSLPNSARIVWTSSVAVDVGAPKGGIDLKTLVKPSLNDHLNYPMSKTGNWFLASEFGKRERSNGVVSLTLNPGQLRTDIWNAAPRWAQIVMSVTLADPKYGAYTQLWAGLNPDITTEDNGRYIMPFGRWHPSPRKDLLSALNSVEDGGTGQALKFWDWCEEETKLYV